MSILLAFLALLACVAARHFWPARKEGRFQPPDVPPGATRDSIGTRRPGDSEPDYFFDLDKRSGKR